MRHAATVRDVEAPKEEPKFLVRLAATATSGTGAIDGDSSGSRQVVRSGRADTRCVDRITPGRRTETARGAELLHRTNRLPLRRRLSAGGLTFDPEPAGPSFSWPCRNLREPGAAPRLPQLLHTRPRVTAGYQEEHFEPESSITAPYHRILQLVQVASTEKAPIYGAFAEPSDGLEPSTPSLPWHSRGNRSQPTATLLAYLSRFRGGPICDRLPPVATSAP
jgi:hypothetical protein